MFALIALALTAAPRSEQSELVDWIVKILGVAVFVGLPLVKAIVQSREKSKEEALKEGRRAGRTKEAEGRRAFDELMRGETTEAPPPVPAPPAPALSRVPEAAPHSAQRTATAARPLADLEEIPEAPLTGSEFEAQEGLPESELGEHIERRKREEQRRQDAEIRIREEIAREQYAASSSLRENVAPIPVEAFRAPAAEAASSHSSAHVARGLFGPGGAADRRAALRRSLVVNEVLGRPVAMRGGPDGPSPGGLGG